MEILSIIKNKKNFVADEMVHNNDFIVVLHEIKLIPYYITTLLLLYKIKRVLYIFNSKLDSFIRKYITPMYLLYRT